MAKSFIIALEGPALTCYTKLLPLSIDSWKTLRDKFLLNFQGYRPDKDALAELSLCRQQEKETLREYNKKFLLLKSQLPSVDDHIAIHYAISGPRAGVLYSQCIRDPPKTCKSYINYSKSMPGLRSSTREKSSHNENPRTLHSPAGHGSVLHNRTQADQIVTSPKCTPSLINSRLEIPLVAMSTLRNRAKATIEAEVEAESHDSEGSTAFSMVKTQHIPLGIALKPRPPRIEWPEINRLTIKELAPIPTIPKQYHQHQFHNEHYHPHQQNHNMYQQHQEIQPLPPPPPHHQNPPPPASKQEDFADQPCQGVIHMITRGSSSKFDTKRQKKDHYRRVNHVALTGLVIQTK
jgi:hypothetical protein